MITSHTPPLPQRTPGTEFVEDFAREADSDLIGRVLAGLMSVAADPLGAQIHCPDFRLEEERRPVPADEEVIRILAPADPDNHDADAWHVVTLTRPRGSSEPFRPFAAYGPMTWDTAKQFLAELGVEAVSVGSRSDFPILDNLPRQ
ncbi:hypothetical protein AB0E01_03110 [Nocardia vinacea]|uniref:hypothetical protein n=1 Tax=Nocardia vinacea TaxID=96468 RepID=UPI00340D5489